MELFVLYENYFERHNFLSNDWLTCFLLMDMLSSSTTKNVKLSLSFDNRWTNSKDIVLHMSNKLPAFSLKILIVIFFVLLSTFFFRVFRVSLSSSSAGLFWNSSRDDNFISDIDRSQDEKHTKKKKNSVVYSKIVDMTYCSWIENALTWTLLFLITMNLYCMMTTNKKNMFGKWFFSLEMKNYFITHIFTNM